jgi:uncharacterized membrane protein
MFIAIIAQSYSWIIMQKIAKSHVNTTTVNGLSMLIGGLFGLITYSTYDLTNLATLKKWPIKITLIDLTWGTSLSAATTLVVFFVV